MATPVEVDNKVIGSQDEKKELSLIEKSPLELLDPIIGQDQTSNSKQGNEQVTKTDEENKGILGSHIAVPGDGPGQGESGSGTVDSLDHKLDSTKSESENTISTQDQTSAGAERPEAPDDAEVPTTDIPSDTRLQNDGNNTGESTPVLDGTSTPPTPRSTPAKPSVFKKTASIQKINLNKDFLKNFVPSNTGPLPGVSTTPRPMASEKPKASSSVTKALKPMVRNRLSNMGGPSMQRQGSGSSTPKSGRGTSPNFGRPGSGSEVWSWRRQPAAQREYSEEELQKQGVHLTARLTTSTGDDANKWADMDDDWSDEDVVEETKEHFEQQNPQNRAEESSPQIAPHLLESAALGRIVDKPEETVIVSKNERFADVTYDRRDTRSPDDNIHGQRQIYNAKIGKFENVEPAQSGRDQERHSRKNFEIMQRGQGRRGSSDVRRRDSLAKGEEVRQSRGLHVDNRGYSSSTQRRTSFAERDPTGFHPHLRRDSFISTSGVSDADRSISNASPGVDSQTTTDQASPVIDLIALQKTEMAESRKRAMERRARDEEERVAAAERARKKAAELGVMASKESSHGKPETPTASTTASPRLPKASPVPPKASPLPPRASPLPAKISPITHVVAPAIQTEDTQPPSRASRSNSGVWTANRDQEEIIRQDSPSKEEARRSTWGVIGSSQKSSTTSHKQQNGLFNNPNTLATLNHTIGGDTRRGRNVLRSSRAPITPTNVPPSLQGWATFAGNLETRKAHDDERQQERNQERERIERERSTNNPRTTSLVDKWKRVEIKEPENAGDVAGRTVVSVLKSGYVEDSSGNLEVKDMPVNQKDRSESTSPGMSTILPADATTPLTSSKSSALSSSATGLGIQASTQPTLNEKPPGSRDRSRFFPTPSSTTVVDMSSRVVHSIQPTVPDKSAFPQSLFPSFEDLSKSPPTSTTTIPPLSSNSSSFGTQRPSFGQYGQGLTTSPGQSLSAAPHIGGLTPRTAFSHTVPTMISTPSQPRYTAKLPSVEDFDTVLARLRESMGASAQETIANEDMTEFTNPDTHDPQSQTRTESTPAASDKRQYMKISALSQHRDLEISTRDVEEEPLPKPAVKVSLPKMLYTSSKDMEPPIDMSTALPPKINLPTHVISHTDTPDAKSRVLAIDNELSPSHPHHHHRPKPPQAFKIQFAPSLRPRGGVVPNLIKFDKADSPYINFEAKPEALSLPAYAHDNELFYTHRDRPFKNKYFKFNKHQGPRKYPKPDRGESSSQSSKSVVASPSRFPEKK